MRGLIHDCVRWFIGMSIVCMGVLLNVRHRWRLLDYERNQRRLRSRYAIGSNVPICEYGRTARASIESFAKGVKGPVRFASTSGTTDEPKRIAYSASRVSRTKFAFIDAFARAYVHLPIKRRSLYVFSALKDDQSLTGMLLREKGSKDLPSSLALLQAPYRVHHHPDFERLTQEYGGSAVRLLILTIANPGVLYATNPSTIAHFLDDLSHRFEATRRLVREVCAAPDRFSPVVLTAMRRLVSRGSKERLSRVASSPVPLGILDCAPAIEATICWTGGYVRPFLERIAEHLPPDRVRRIAMYSMSTETIETLPHYAEGKAAFLPIAPGVLYEFLEENALDLPENLLSPRELECGRNYSLVVSDGYGLRRYQTGDIFRVEGKIGHRMRCSLPDLHFVRRRGLTFSFTGEKVTAEQVAIAIDRLRVELRESFTGWFFSMIPSSPAQDLPHYKLALVRGSSGGTHDLGALGVHLDRILGEVNEEYGQKRASGRLGSIDVVPLDLASFGARVAPSADAGLRSDWESQFKFLPLYPRLWEGVSG